VQGDRRVDGLREKGKERDKTQKKREKKGKKGNVT